MLKSRLIALFAFLSLCISTAQAVITKVEILKGNNPKTGQEQYVYLLSDTHNSMGISTLAEVGYNQRNALLQMLSNCDQKYTKVIVEDSAMLQVYDYISKTKGIQIESCIELTNCEEMQSNFDVLSCLSYHIAQLGLETINVEFRLPDQNYPIFVSNTIN